MASAGSPTAVQVVGNAFVQQYYHILHQSPELVHRFYQDGSTLGRPETEGTMSSVTTMEAINEKILSMNYGEYMSEIKTVDAQDSLNGAVLVLVTGYLQGKDNVRRDFTQSFFLATEDKGHFVLNDIFRYVHEADNTQQIEASGGDVGAQNTSEQQELWVPQEDVGSESDEKPPTVADEIVNEEGVHNPSDNEEVSVVEEEIPVAEVTNEVPSSSEAAVADFGSSTVQEEAPKKSYASIVKVPAALTTNISTPRSVLPSKERQVAAVPASAPLPEIPAVSSNVTETSRFQDAEVEGHSIYIKSLPLNALPVQLEELFKKFGPIKPHGIQVRSNKQQGFCFGFVEFELASAVQSAIEASPIMIGGRQAYVEEKRPAGSRGGSRGRFTPGSSGVGFRNDGMRGCGNVSSGRSNGRGDFNARGDYRGRGGGRGGSSGQGEVGYQRVDSMGSSGGRGNRSPGSTATARVPAPT